MPSKSLLPKQVNFFDARYTDVTNRYDKASAVRREGIAQGFLSENGALNFGQGSELANMAARAQAFFNREKQSGTPEYRQRQREQGRLVEALGRNGTFVTQSRYNKWGKAVGTDLLWRPDESTGFSKPVVMASMGRAGAGTRDFFRQGVWGYPDLAEGLAKNVVSERFHDLYQAVFGEHVREIYPSEDELKALGHMKRYHDAAEVVRRGDPRKANGAAGNGGAR